MPAEEEHPLRIRKQAGEHSPIRIEKIDLQKYMHS